MMRAHQLIRDGVTIVALLAVFAIATASCGAKLATDASSAGGTQGPPPIAQVIVTPNPASVPRGSTFAFQARCIDVNGFTVPCPPLIWSIDSARVGTMAGGGPPAPGLFQAAAIATAQVVATVTGSTVNGRAAVSIP